MITKNASQNSKSPRKAKKLKNKSLTERFLKKKRFLITRVVKSTKDIFSELPSPSKRRKNLKEEAK